jgi:hypothetical protein
MAVNRRVAVHDTERHGVRPAVDRDAHRDAARGRAKCAPLLGPGSRSSPAHAGGELERHTFENTNGREDCKKIYAPPKNFQISSESGRKRPAVEGVWPKLSLEAARCRRELANKGAQFGIAGRNRRSVVAVETGLAARSQRVQHVLILLPTSRRQAEHSLDRSVPAHRTAPAARGRQLWNSPGSGAASSQLSRRYRRAYSQSASRSPLRG